jgi:hypothetical protein
MVIASSKNTPVVHFNFFIEQECDANYSTGHQMVEWWCLMKERNWLKHIYSWCQQNLGLNYGESLLMFDGEQDYNAGLYYDGGVLI